MEAISERSLDLSMLSSRDPQQNHISIASLERIKSLRIKEESEVAEDEDSD